MAVDAESFLALCKELRKLGACKVEGWGFSAVFVPTADAHKTPQAQAAARTPKQPKEPKLVTPEEARELAYARELGKVR